MQHTPTPWRTLNLDDRKPGDYVNVGGSYRDGKPRVVASMYFRVEADARRAVACVNACEGIDDPAAALAEVRAAYAEYDRMDGAPAAHNRLMRAMHALTGRSVL